MSMAVRVFAGGGRVARASDSVTRHRENWRAARAVQADLHNMGMPRVNLMLTGSSGVLENVIEALLPDLRGPIGRWCPGEELVLPPAGRVGTLILQEVGSLPLQDQGRLYEWLNQSASRTQVVSTTSISLLHHLEDGRFMDWLYYRLNIMCLDVNA